MPAAKDLVLAVISDTHVGDRMHDMPTELLEHLTELNPDVILHAGDVSFRRILDQLAEIAPVHAVQGNRDWMMGHQLPNSLQFTFNGMHLTLSHGHINILQYLLDFLVYFFKGYTLTHTRYQENLGRLFPKADIIIYGHTHYQMDEIMGGQHFFNPGAVFPDRHNQHNPQYGILRISITGDVTGELRSIHQI